jgi:hypothetical protein
MSRIKIYPVAYSSMEGANEYLEFCHSVEMFANRYMVLVLSSKGFEKLFSGKLYCFLVFQVKIR